MRKDSRGNFKAQMIEKMPILQWLYVAAECRQMWCTHKEKKNGNFYYRHVDLWGMNSVKLIPFLMMLLVFIVGKRSW